MKIEFWGVRGSYAVPGPNTVKFGGNTTCVSISKEVDGKNVRILVDSGTGIIPAGQEIIKNFFAKKEDLQIPICFTHLHPDHTQGFPFFAPNFFPNSTLHLLGFKALKKHIGMVLEGTMLPPTFPIEYKDLKSNRIHYEVKDNLSFYVNKNGSVSMNASSDDVFMVKTMQAYAPSHPQQGAVYYRVFDIETGKSVSCCWDLESHSGGDMRVISFVNESDVLIHDTQYTDSEYYNANIVVQGFGHSTYSMALENATKAKVKKLVCMHYNPSHSDDKLNTIKQELQNNSKTVEVVFAVERESLEV